MSVKSISFEVKTSGRTDILDITNKVRKEVSSSGMVNGTVTVFIPGSTAGVTTIEYESGVVNDLKKAIEKLAPAGIHYDHDSRWGDGNGYSHVRAALLGASLSVPFNNSDLKLGTWQQIVLMDFDNRPRSRNILVQIVGE
tara:strand:+ start:1520 stop:1939 length:420 start_codon:yes stop_codon:yes gene_type:complete